jgi:Protein kinase domain
MHGRLTLGCVHLTTSGQPMIADFGLAALEEAAAEAEMQLGFFQTRMSYSAPELTRGGLATVRGDTYSIALLFYRLLAGSNPFRGRSIPETLQRVQQLAPADLMLPDWKRCRDANRVLKRALDKEPSARFADCVELSAALAELSPESDERCREELAALVRRHGAGDWAQLARLGRSSRRSQAPVSSPEVERLMAAVPHESKAPAFVSGLVTEQPRSVSEHSLGEKRERQRRDRRRQMMLPTVLIPAVAIIFGLFLGRLGGTRAGESRAAAGQVAATPPLVNALVEELRVKLQRCGPERGGAPPSYHVELEFAGSGELSGVRLEPRELSHSRLGACLLETAWEAGLRAPGAISVSIPLGAPR